MAGVSVTYRWNQPAFQKMLRDSGGTVDQAVARAAGRTRDRAKQNLSRRVDTGHLRQSIVSQRTESITGVTYQVGSPLPYAIFQEKGTRDHGPRNFKFMRFKPKGSSTFVFAKHVRGVQAANFLADALRSLTPADFTP
jgi:HK97 gp10 family phage protein